MLLGQGKHGAFLGRHVLQGFLAELLHSCSEPVQVAPHSCFVVTECNFEIARMPGAVNALPFELRDDSVGFIATLPQPGEQIGVLVPAATLNADGAGVSLP